MRELIYTYSLNLQRKIKEKIPVKMQVKRNKVKQQKKINGKLQ